jgi:hypothetical protein
MIFTIILSLPYQEFIYYFSKIWNNKMIKDISETECQLALSSKHNGGGKHTSGLYYKNMTIVNDDHHEWSLYYKYYLGA